MSIVGPAPERAAATTAPSGSVTVKGTGRDMRGEVVTRRAPPAERSPALPDPLQHRPPRRRQPLGIERRLELPQPPPEREGAPPTLLVEVVPGRRGAGRAV